MTPLEKEQEEKILLLEKNLKTAEKNLNSVVGELTKAMNCLFCLPLEAFTDETREWFLRYKQAFEQMKQENSGDRNE